MGEIIVVKLGGSSLYDLTANFYEKLKAMQENGQKLVIVHGGGPEINRYLNQLNIKSEFHNGLRKTTKEAIEIVEMVLTGKVNPFVVRLLNDAGIRAVGLNGSDDHLLEARFLDKASLGYVGQIEDVNSRFLLSILDLGIVPVIASVGRTASGEVLNINADTVASEIARTIHAETLMLVTDVDGIKHNGQTIKETTPLEIQQLIQQGIIYGGMIPKVEAALKCLESKIREVMIFGKQLDGTKIVHEEVLV